MSAILEFLWLVPVLPLVAAGLLALARQRQRKFAASLAIVSMGLALVLSCIAFAQALHPGQGEASRQIFNFRWFQFGDAWLKLGWVLDPLSALMLVMVSFVGLLIFIYSLGYMARDENFTRFFCFLSLFAAAMLGLVIANSLLLLFICWELVGLTSYLLIGFWYHKPSAAAAAKKAFIVTRIGDLAFLLGIVWLYSQTGALLFYDHGQGCLESSLRAILMERTTSLGLTAATGIGLLLFCGAIGKSGQVPLHVWLPDAMEGPTPVSALIHAATMVAAGVFLVARVYPLLGEPVLSVITWVGAITAVFAAGIALAQTDLKRILAYSTISQLGYMMLGLGTGGVAVGMFHLVTHAFFKALLFLGAGSVIHACQDEQDIRCLGGLRKLMPLTFATYAIGMLSLSGFPLLFAGFWSKDGILESAHAWPVTPGPFYLGLAGAFLTVFYMTRQVCYAFFGNRRLPLRRTSASKQRTGGLASIAPERGCLSRSSNEGTPISKSTASSAGEAAAAETAALRADGGRALPPQPHEGPWVMTLPLIILAFFAVMLGFIGTPAWPWFQGFINGQTAVLDTSRLLEKDLLSLMGLSTILVFAGLALGWWFYGRQPLLGLAEPDPLESRWPNMFYLLSRKFFVDEIYDQVFVRLNAAWATACDWLDRWVWQGGVQLLSWAVVALAWVNRFLDEHAVNLGFDQGCRSLSEGGGLLSRLQNGQVQNYLRILGVALVVLVLFLIWGCRAS